MHRTSVHQKTILWEASEAWLQLPEGNRDRCERLLAELFRDIAQHLQRERMAIDDRQNTSNAS